MKRQVFYSFHYDNDVFRVQQIRNIGVIEDNKPVAVNAWEEIRNKGTASIEKWIDENMKYRSCVVVLVGEETSNRPWVQYEIKKAWEDGKGLVGVYIHNLKCPRNGTCNKGPNPFEQFTFQNPKLFRPKKLSDVVKCYDPIPWSAYNIVTKNLESWVEEAISIRERY